MKINTGFSPPPLSLEDAIGIFHQAADGLTVDGKNHKILQEALRVVTEAAKRLRELENPAPPAS